MIKGNPSWLLLLCIAFVMIGNAADVDKKKSNDSLKKGTRNTKEEDKKKDDAHEKEEEVFKVTELTEEELDVDEEKKKTNEAEKKEEVKQEPEETAKESESAEDREDQEEAASQEVEEDEQEPQEEEAKEEPEKEPAITEEKEKAVQEAKPEEAPSQPALGPDEIMGIDTVDLEDPQGNWLYKRVWWERAEAKYEKIRAAVTSVLELRTRFFTKRAELDKNVLDPFYVKTGFSQGELKEKLAERIARLEQDIQTKSNAELLERLEDAKQTLQDLRKEVDIVLKYDNEIEQAILMLVEQSNKMRNYEQQAWQNFKNIARVLDDKKARELFYKVDGAWRNIQDLKQYVESNFSSGFDQLVERLVKQIEKVDAALQQLKEKGIEIKMVEQEELEVEEVPQPGIFSRFIIIPIKTVLRTIWDGITWPVRKLMGKSVTSPTEAKSVMPVNQEESMKPSQEPEQARIISAPPVVPLQSPEGTLSAAEDFALKKEKQSEGVAKEGEDTKEPQEAPTIDPVGEQIMEETIAVDEGEPATDEAAESETEE